MKAIAKLEHLKSDEDKRIITRNLSRILNVRILDIDVENQKIFFLYATPLTFQQVKQELWRIGFPINLCKYPTAQNPYVHHHVSDNFEVA
ncbi:hypothetical protein OO009_05850 [Flavobacteriaceae bacterium KMM 6897]|nr:hypothetical protein [Flavobacteriaceae bacterium KMM 6897]MEB8345216.1 hypothetical protein [Flavobacteriaceae bacterium KMM 6898]